MPRHFLVALISMLSSASAVSAQQGPLQRVGQALDRTGKNIRRDVEGAVARGQMSAQERELLARVSQRINWDKQLAGSTLQLVVQVDGTVYLRGSVASALAKARAVDLAENTIGVARVVDELAVVREVKVIESRPSSVPPAPLPATRVTPLPPVESEVIVKP